MPGFLLDTSASVMCMHGGTAQPTSSEPRVRISGMPIVTQAASYSVAGCSFVPPAGNGPCVSAQWTTAAQRVKAGGLPVLLRDSQAVCTPTGTGLNIVSTQTRVQGN